jgi:small GTP-binding protein
MTAYKIMLLGDIGVGKSSISQRLVFDRFSFDYKPTIGVDVYRYQVSEGLPEPVDLIVWDTDGNLGDLMFRHVYMRSASAALIVGDLTRIETLDTMVRLAESFSRELPGRYIGYLLNKVDIVDQPETILLPKALSERRAETTFTSAMNGQNVVRSFVAAAQAIHRRGLG